MGSAWSGPEQPTTAENTTLTPVDDILNGDTETQKAIEEAIVHDTIPADDPPMNGDDQQQPSLGSFVLLEFPEADELVTEETPQQTRGIVRVGQAVTWLPRQMQAGIEKVAGRCVEGLIGLTPEQGRQLLGSYILFALNLALEGTAALHDEPNQTDDPAGVSEEQAHSSLNFLLRRVVEPNPVQSEATERLAQHGGNIEEAEREAFSYYLGMRAKVEIVALKQLPGPAGLLYAFYLHLRFTAIVALLNGYDTNEPHTLFLVAFCALGFEPDSTLTTEKEVEQIATQTLVDSMSFRQYLVKLILEKASERILTTVIGQELFATCEVLLLTKEIVGALWMSKAPLQRAQKLFPAKADASQAASSQ